VITKEELEELKSASKGIEVINIQSLIPRINEMTPHKCLWCGTSILTIPGTLHAIYCQSNGFSHTSEEPYLLMGYPEDCEQKVTFFNFDGTESRRGIVKLLKNEEKNLSSSFLRTSCNKTEPKN